MGWGCAQPQATVLAAGPSLALLFPVSGPPGEMEAGQSLSEAMDWPGFHSCSPGVFLPGPLSWGCRPGVTSLRVMVAPAALEVPLPGSPWTRQMA